MFLSVIKVFFSFLADHTRLKRLDRWRNSSSSNNNSNRFLNNSSNSRTLLVLHLFSVMFPSNDQRHHQWLCEINVSSAVFIMMLFLTPSSMFQNSINSK
jgi:hypothetical protein